ncbi:MAG TPA: isoprenylcysteine carboxylmethyltransferase family protein [Candidatus Limnocylindrales bacterium]|nr:isoprenylcysteine carboxylmethyltransferase family protein [Candidatus Limnocylindrales bacterium]
MALNLRLAVANVIFAIGQPGLVAGLLPYWITDGWHSADEPPAAAQLVGAVLLVAGLAALAHTVIRFAVEGRGTPFPAAPTERLVVGGLYRHVRNPMYLAVLATIVGQAAILGRPVLLAYAIVVWVVVASFVRLYEEPALAIRYGAQYEAYRRSVRAWWPRLTPWTGEEPADARRDSAPAR